VHFLVECRKLVNKNARNEQYKKFNSARYYLMLRKIVEPFTFQL